MFSLPCVSASPTQMFSTLPARVYRLHWRRATHRPLCFDLVPFGFRLQDADGQKLCSELRTLFAIGRAQGNVLCVLGLCLAQ